MTVTTGLDRIKTPVEVLRRKGVKYLRWVISDLHGTSRSKVIPTEEVGGYARKGLNFYKSVLAMDTASNTVSAPGFGAEAKYGDMLLFPDMDTLIPVPWLPNTGTVICDAYTSLEQPLKVAPRYVLKQLLELASQLGFSVKMGHEFEFYLLDAVTKEPLFDGKHIFNSTRNSYVPAIYQMLDYLQQSGIDVITHNCESGPSQFEINYSPSIGIEAADKAFTFKNCVKEIGHHLGYQTTFMSKPFANRAGSGCHFHISLINLQTNCNAFFDPFSKDGLSETAGSFIQGVLDHASSIMPIIAPTPNCYRRLKPHTFAPSNISYGIEDRSAMIRVKATGDEATHIEVRAASGLSNPYLTAAAILAAGLLGIKQKRKLQLPIDGLGEDDTSLPKLPRTLEEALSRLESDLEICSLLGKEFCQLFAAVKRFELKRFYDQITEWERSEYLEVY